MLLTSIIYVKTNIVCIQEHWMWEYQKHELQDLALDKDSFTRCSDYSEALTGFSLPRGHGRVSILWSSKVKKLSEGYERKTLVGCVEA